MGDGRQATNRERRGRLTALRWQENRRDRKRRLAEGREGPPSPKSVTRKSLGRNTVHGRSGSRRKKEKQKSDEEEEQTNGNGTEKGMLMMMTKKRMEKTRQGKTNDKRRIIVSGVPIPNNEVVKGLTMLRMMMVNDIENGNEE